MIAHDPLPSGNHAQAHEGIGVADTCLQKPASDQTRHSVPRQVVSLTATLQNDVITTSASRRSE
jgi:hypothetical protein